MNNKTKMIAFCAIFAGLTAVFSQIGIPVPPIPINLGTLAFFLAGGILGPIYGSISQLIWVLLGVMGLPVFSKFQGGPAVLVGPTGGYIVGYILGALIVGFVAVKFGRNFFSIALAGTLGLLVCYIFGTTWYMILTGVALLPALSACVFPFLIGDVIKIAIAVVLVPKLHSALSKQNVF